MQLTIVTHTVSTEVLIGKRIFICYTEEPYSWFHYSFAIATGYGKSVYFWALVSALGTFFLGAGMYGTTA
jgi:hypothetical protein